jgi:hypothetical protein
MATKIVFHPFPPPASHVGRAGCWNVLRSLALVIGLFFCFTSARAQLQQPFVFAVDPANPRGIPVFTRNDLNGVLTPIPGSVSYALFRNFSHFFTPVKITTLLFSCDCVLFDKEQGWGRGAHPPTGGIHRYKSFKIKSFADP